LGNILLHHVSTVRRTAAVVVGGDALGLADLRASGGRHGGRFLNGGFDGEFAGLIAVLPQLGGLKIDAVDAVGTGGKDGGEEAFETGDVAKGDGHGFVDAVVVDQVAFAAFGGAAFLIDRVDFDEVGLDVGGGDGFRGGGFQDRGDGLVVARFGKGKRGVAAFDADRDDDAVGGDLDFGIASNGEAVVVELGEEGEGAG